MSRFTFIVTCYNAEQTIKRCLDSILSQCFNDFNVIILDDGSTDASANIINEYLNDDQRLSYHYQINQGVAVARNNAIQMVETDYFIFVDSDDYIGSDFLNSINNKIGEVDLLKYNLQMVDELGLLLSKTHCTSFIQTGIDSLITLIHSKSLFTGTCMYVYKTDFVRDHNFQFEIGRKHEDYGLIPWMIVNANMVSSIDDAHYYYVQTDQSITRGNTDEKRYQMALDMLYLSNQLLVKMDSVELSLYNKKQIQSFIAMSTMLYLRNLKGKEVKAFIKQLKAAKYIDYMLTDTFIRKLKKLAYKTNIGLFVRYL